MVKWLPVFTLHCLWTRRLGTKGLLVSSPPPSPPDRFFLFNQRVKWETQGLKKKKKRKKGKVVGKGWKPEASIQKISLGSSRCRVLATRKGSQQNARSYFHTARLPFRSLRASGSFGFPLPPSDHIHYFPQDNTIKLVFTDILSSQPVWDLF